MIDWERPPIRNTVGYRTMTHAIFTNVQAYGAVGMTEKRLFPLLAAEGATFALDMDYTFTGGAIRLPICPKIGEGSELRMGKVDLGVATYGVGYRWNAFSFHVALSVATHYISNGETMNRGIVGIGLPLFAMAYFPVSFYKPTFYRDNMSASYSHLLGASYNSPIGALSIAYSTDRGIYSNITGTKVKLFAGFLAREALKDLPYLSLGLASLDFLVSPAMRKLFGDTSIYVRKLQFVGLTPPEPSNEETSTAKVERTSFVTQHFEQTGIAEMVDVFVAYSTSPKPMLYEATLGLHTVGYRSPKSLIATASRKVEERPDSYGVNVSVGVIQLPDLWYYGVQGGYRFKASVSVAASSGGVVFATGLSVNDADILSVFPYAYNAPQFFFLVAGNGK